MTRSVLQSALVTGASGFIGKRLVRRLMADHCRLTCLVRPTSRADDLRSLDVRLVTGDVTEHATLERALDESQAETVFHLAGLTRAQRHEDFNRVNAEGARVVAATCAARHNPPVLIVISSLAAAGPCAPQQMHREDDPPAPVSTYGRSKLAGEMAAASYAAAAPITIVRPPIVYGPGDTGILEILRPIARWNLHLVPGKDSHRYSLLHIDDLVEGLLRAAETGERLPPFASQGGQGIYYIAGEETPSYEQLGQLMATALGGPAPTVVHVNRTLVRLVGAAGDAAGWISRDPGWVNSDKVAESLAGSWICSSAKARKHLDWAPMAALPERLHETVQWYRQAGWL